MNVSVLRTPVLWRGERELLGLADMGPRDDHVRAELLAPLHLPPSPVFHPNNNVTVQESQWTDSERERQGVANATTELMGSASMACGLTDLGEGCDGGHEARHGDAQLGPVPRQGERVVACPRIRRKDTTGIDR